MKIDLISFALGFASCIIFVGIMFYMVYLIAEISDYDPYDHDILKPIRGSGIPRYDGPPAPPPGRIIKEGGIPSKPQIPPMKYITEGKDPEYQYKTASKGSSLHGRIK